MDIIDIMLAKALTPQGQTDAYVAKANKAAAKAAKAEQDATAAIATVDAAAEDIAAKVEAADDLLAEAQEVLETAQQAQINMPEVYTTTGQNTDGYMTQKAVTDALAEKADTSSLNIYVTTTAMNTALEEKADASALAGKADKTYVDNAITNIPTSGGGNTYLGEENEGKIVVVGADGNVAAGAISEEEIIESLMMIGGYTARNAVGLEIDYENKTFTRTQGAVNKSMGSDFNSYLMYGGRRRCIVNDSGEIVAFYGEEGYIEDGTAGQVMIYQPKFYYQRIPLNTTVNKVGKIVTRDSLMISTTPQNGFKVHPLFLDANGDELDYVFLSAYEGGVYSASYGAKMGNVYNSLNTENDKMLSVMGTRPITGDSGMNLANAEKLANNRGTGWHIFNLAAESANQMLEIIEFGTLNGQSALGRGVSDMGVGGATNKPAISGSTIALGNGSGSATETRYNGEGGNYFTENTAGKVSICYRGMENPWGNVWKMIGGLIVNGNGLVNGGVPYICTNFNYSYNSLANNYKSAGFSLPNGNGWISALGYGEKDYDWVLMPAAADSSANSALPVGDNGWFDANLTGNRLVTVGGSWSFAESNGPFYYACDKPLDNSIYTSYGARLMFIPTKNSIYTANIQKWQQEMNIGG